MRRHRTDERCPSRRTRRHVQPFFFADCFAQVTALEGRFEAAARLAGYADAGNARVGERQSNEDATVARAAQLARAALGDAAFDRLRAEGIALSAAGIEALAFPEDIKR